VQGIRLVPGSTTPVQFEVTNLGPAGTFLVTAADEGGFTGGLSPTTLDLGENEAAITTASLAVPSGNTRLFDMLTVVVRNAANPAVNNSTRLGLEIGVPDSDGDGIADDVDACPGSILGASIVIDACDSGVGNTLAANGCTRSDSIAPIAAGAADHGAFVSGVAALTNTWVSEGILSGREKGAIQSCASKAKLP